MSTFLYPSYILSEDRKILLRELSNSVYKSLVKTIIIDDNDVLERFIDNLLQNCFDDTELQVVSLTNIDKLYMLICIRSYCIGSQIIFSTKTPRTNSEGKKEELKVEVPLELNEVLNRLGNYPIEHMYSFTESGLTVSGTLPKRFYYEHILDVVADSLSTITTPKRSTDLDNLKHNERRKVMGSLPSGILPKIIGFLQAQEDIIKEDPLIKFNTDMELPFGKQLDLQLYNGTVGEIIKMLFNANLKDLYSTEYTLMRRFKFTFSAIEKCTPAELNVYYEIIHKDLEREKEEQEKDKGGAGSLPAGMPEAPKNLPTG